MLRVATLGNKAANATCKVVMQGHAQLRLCGLAPQLGRVCMAHLLNLRPVAIRSFGGMNREVHLRYCMRPPGYLKRSF